LQHAALESISFYLSLTRTHTHLPRVLCSLLMLDAKDAKAKEKQDKKDQAAKKRMSKKNGRLKEEEEKEEDGEKGDGEAADCLEDGDVDGEDIDELKEGDAVEANFKGKGQWYPGIITKRNAKDEDGRITYDITFDDDEKEDGVEQECVRVQAGPSGADRASEMLSMGMGIASSVASSSVASMGNWLSSTTAVAAKDPSDGEEGDTKEAEARKTSGGIFGGFSKTMANFDVGGALESASSAANSMAAKAGELSAMVDVSAITHLIAVQDKSDDESDDEDRADDDLVTPADVIAALKEDCDLPDADFAWDKMGKFGNNNSGFLEGKVYRFDDVLRAVSIRTTSEIKQDEANARAKQLEKAGESSGRERAETLGHHADTLSGFANRKLVNRTMHKGTGVMMLMANASGPKEGKKEKRQRLKKEKKEAKEAEKKAKQEKKDADLALAKTKKELEVAAEAEAEEHNVGIEMATRNGAIEKAIKETSGDGAIERAIKETSGDGRVPLVAPKARTKLFKVKKGVASSSARKIVGDRRDPGLSAMNLLERGENKKIDPVSNNTGVTTGGAVASVVAAGGSSNGGAANSNGGAANRGDAAPPTDLSASVMGGGLPAGMSAGMSDVSSLGGGLSSGTAGGMTSGMVGMPSMAGGMPTMLGTSSNPTMSSTSSNPNPTCVPSMEGMPAMPDGMSMHAMNAMMDKLPKRQVLLEEESGTMEFEL
jgi:hypothetical protein